MKKNVLHWSNNLYYYNSRLEGSEPRERHFNLPVNLQQVLHLDLYFVKKDGPTAEYYMIVFEFIESFVYWKFSTNEEYAAELYRLGYLDKMVN